jgi:hypothetical protein
MINLKDLVKNAPVSKLVKFEINDNRSRKVLKECKKVLKVCKLLCLILIALFNLLRIFLIKIRNGLE